MSQVAVKILQQDYVLSCPDGQEQALLEAVAKANQAMQPLCESAKVRTREQAAVLVAVNFAFQNQALQKHINQLEQKALQLVLPTTQPQPQEEDSRIHALCQRIDQALACPATAIATDDQPPQNPSLFSTE